MRQANPAKAMTKHNADGDSYSISLITLTNGRRLEDLDVLAHDDHWILVQDQAKSEFHIAWASIATITIDHF